MLKIMTGHCCKLSIDNPLGAYPVLYKVIQLYRSSFARTKNLEK